MLPADFLSRPRTRTIASTKQDAMKQAEVLGIAERTMERWLLKLVQSADIERIGQGIYKKVALKNASA